MEKNFVVITHVCSACSGCASVCPADAIEMGHASAVITDRCIGCGICARFCPLSSIAPVATERPD